VIEPKGCLQISLSAAVLIAGGMRGDDKVLATTLEDYIQMTE